MLAASERAPPRVGGDGLVAFAARLYLLQTSGTLPACPVASVIASPAISTRGVAYHMNQLKIIAIVLRPKRGWLATRYTPKACQVKEPFGKHAGRSPAAAQARIPVEQMRLGQAANATPT